MKFPEKLWTLVHDNACEALHWNYNGDRIVVDMIKLKSDILDSPYRFFKTNHLASFVRQLNIYGFRKSKTTSTELGFGVREYEHQFFLRGRKDLLAQMKRQLMKQTSPGYFATGLRKKCAKRLMFPNFTKIKEEPVDGSDYDTMPSSAETLARFTAAYSSTNNSVNLHPTTKPTEPGIKLNTIYYPPNNSASKTEEVTPDVLPNTQETVSPPSSNLLDYYNTLRYYHIKLWEGFQYLQGCYLEHMRVCSNRTGTADSNKINQELSGLSLPMPTHTGYPMYFDPRSYFNAQYGPAQSKD